MVNEYIVNFRFELAAMGDVDDQKLLNHLHTKLSDAMERFVQDRLYLAASVPRTELIHKPKD